MIFTNLKRRGYVAVISAPSGTGKTTVANKVVQKLDNIELSISVNTRKKRPLEVDGIDYHFVSEEEFETNIKCDNFLEYTSIYGQMCGTLKNKIFSNIESGIDTICTLDWNGAQKLKNILKDDLFTIFLYPPSLATLEERLLNRKQDEQKEITKRLALAELELKNGDKYDYSVINDDIEKCCYEVENILQAERNKTYRLAKQI